MLNSEYRLIGSWPIRPTPAPRQSRSDAFEPRPCVQRYRAFQDEVRLRGVEVPTDGFYIVWWIPIPKSWSNKKRLAHSSAPHLSRPDRDNLEKALLDSLYGEDSHCWRGGSEKRWTLDQTGGFDVWMLDPAGFDGWMFDERGYRPKDPARRAFVPFAGKVR